MPCLGASAISHSQKHIKGVDILRTFDFKCQAMVKQRRKVSEVYLAGNSPNIRHSNVCLETLEKLTFFNLHLKPEKLLKNVIH